MEGVNYVLSLSDSVGEVIPPKCTKKQTDTKCMNCSVVYVKLSSVVYSRVESEKNIIGPHKRQLPKIFHESFLNLHSPGFGFLSNFGGGAPKQPSFGLGSLGGIANTAPAPGCEYCTD